MIEPETFLETLFMWIRGETIKYSSLKKKDYEIKEKLLLKNTEMLEAMDDFCAMDNDLIENKQQLEVLRKKGQRSNYKGKAAMAQWGRKHHKFFLQTRT